MIVHFHDISEQADIESAGGGTRTEHSGVYRTGLKRVLDFTLVLITLPISLPLILIFAALVAMDGHNPFYRQDRVGLHGRVFRIWKLRSMVPNADEQLSDYLASNASARAEWDKTQKLKNDPRITALGRFVRRSSIDELPQLFNVLTGDMSLVGPRPMMVSQTSMYPGTAYFRMRPGITGLWQISDRNECSFAERALFDARYHEDISLGQDAKILALTVGTVLRCTGY